MPAGWRIVPRHRAAAAFTGEGARLNGARWISRGIPLVYTSEHLSLAALEVLVHRQVGRWPWPALAFRAEWHDALVERLTPDQLPPDWRSEPPADCLRDLGDAWAREQRSAVLAVPSLIIPEERNCLLNPAHPDFKQIRVGKPQPFAFDPRLLTRCPPSPSMLLTATTSKSPRVAGALSKTSPPRTRAGTTPKTCRRDSPPAAPAPLRP